jgi:1-deoxy-D-xylulose-5-phosphate synthase
VPKLLDTINLPHEIAALNLDQLKQLIAELRDELIETVSQNGGHFASSLGAAEITVALHHCFNAPHDRLVWDVGHQAYIHKMLTGRRDQLATIRKRNGLSGFLRRDESQYDAFGAGHAGTSISAAVGMRVALDHGSEERKKRFVVSVIGDGSMTAGMVFEALNHAGELGLKNFIVLLNDNEMSISPNVGAISWLFSRAVTSRASNFARRNFKQLYQSGYLPEIVYKVVDRAEEQAQGFINGAARLFEAFGFRYIGPVDGHNIESLTSAIRHAKEQDVPVLIHAYTTKGKGYEPAEEDPIKWHGVLPFDRRRGEFLKPSSTPNKKLPSYTQVFSETLLRIAKGNPKVCAITAAMASGTGLDRFFSELPHQVYDVGICEQHAVTFAAGLACEGLKPVCAIYSTFLQRAYDQVVHDVCIQSLPVFFSIDRAGVVGNDGETHQGVFDVAYLRTLPEIVIMSPKDEAELQQMIVTGVNYDKGPIALRYPRGSGYGVELSNNPTPLEIGRSELLRGGEDCLCIAFGPLAHNMALLSDELKKQHGYQMAVINARFVKPLDIKMLEELLPKYREIFSVEDHALQGGFASAILEFKNHLEQKKEIKLSPIKLFGIGDRYVMHASQDEQHRDFGYDVQSIYKYLINIIEKEKNSAKETAPAIRKAVS